MQGVGGQQWGGIGGASYKKNGGQKKKKKNTQQGVRGLVAGGCGEVNKKGEGDKGPQQGLKGPLSPPQVLENLPAGGWLTFLVPYKIHHSTHAIKSTSDICTEEAKK